MSSSQTLDNYSTQCFKKRIRLFMTLFVCCDAVGFLILILKNYVYQGQSKFTQTLYFLFSLLTIFKITIHISSFICQQNHNYIQNLPTFRNNFKSITTIMEYVLSLRALKQLWNIFMILLSPFILFPTWLNEHLLILSQIRVYQVVQYFFDINIKMKINNTQKIDLDNFCWKTGFHKYFQYRLLGIVLTIVFGLGNIVKDYQTSGINDIDEVIYFMLVSMSTVGFGDLHPADLLPRAITIACIILGVFGFSMITSKIVASSKLTLKENREYHLLQKLSIQTKAKQMIQSLFLQQFDNQNRETDTETTNKFLRDEDDSWQYQIQQIVQEFKYLQSINPTTISSTTNKANRLVDKVISLNLINSYLINVCQNLKTKNRRRQGQRYPQFLAPY